MAALGEGKMSKGLKKFLTKEVVEAKAKEELVVTDPKLGACLRVCVLHLEPAR